MAVDPQHYNDAAAKRACEKAVESGELCARARRLIEESNGRMERLAERYPNLTIVPAERAADRK
ncbi:hypothetical protein Lesp02_40030 [Lentzea sp. NBRC 105346]|uniref:hypothetical protein n=1 Tax=Lentzea sp. NBRC 105346 TaxID=3032205 RepID=UPI0024A28858|nr:hypothetical protein [Lentzea sp. NBRC 105346]GLZ31815.1 hypothetical protein Lesp02_40030 [Lentzea sp. NBRC 105346]